MPTNDIRSLPTCLLAAKEAIATIANNNSVSGLPDIPPPTYDAASIVAVLQVAKEAVETLASTLGVIAPTVNLVTNTSMGLSISVLSLKTAIETISLRA